MPQRNSPGASPHGSGPRKRGEPPGHDHDHGRDGEGTAYRWVAEVQRRRILAGTAQAACELGAANATVTEIVRRAGVSRRTFYQSYASAPEALLACIEEAIGLAEERLRAATVAHSRWEDRIRAGIAAIAELCEQEPQLANLLFVQARGAGTEVAAVRSIVIAMLTDQVDAGRRECPKAQRPGRLAAEAAVGALLEIVAARLQRPDSPPLTSLIGELAAVVVLPYRGAAAAHSQRAAANGSRRQRTATATTTAVATAAAPPPQPAELLRESGLRLTYRTLLAIEAMADRDPQRTGLSNREIGQGCGVPDQGQISKILARLERHGLAENIADARSSTRNAWLLTPAGRRLHQTLLAHRQDP